MEELNHKQKAVVEEMLSDSIENKVVDNLLQRIMSSTLPASSKDDLMGV